MTRLLAAAALVAGLCRAAAADPSSPLLDAAAAAVRSGDRETARALLTEASGAKPDDERREAIALLYADLKDYATAQALIDGLIAERPREPRLRLYLATIVARAGDRAATLAALGEARRRAPNAEDRQRMAFLHQDFKDYGPARELLDELVAESPRNLSVRLDRAAVAARTWDAPSGLEHLAAAAALDPGPAERRRMAALYRDLRELGRAGALLDRLILESPADGGLRLERAALAARAGDRAAALESLSAALERGPSLDDRRRAASLYQELKEHGKARAVLAGIARDAPRDPAAWRELAAHDARRGARAAARGSLGKARALRPDLQDRQAMSLIYADLLEHETARALIDALIAEQPGDPQLRLNRAYIAAGAGDRAGALAFLAETLARAPDADDRLRIATLYERLGAFEEARSVRGAISKKSR